jgi:hypothetical protein
VKELVTAGAVGIIGTVILAVTFEVLQPEPRVTHAVGVVSPCGVYAVVASKSDGTFEVYDAENEADEDEATVILALPDNKRVTVVVPCPAFTVEPGA